MLEYLDWLKTIFTRAEVPAEIQCRSAVEGVHRRINGCEIHKIKVIALISSTAVPDQLGRGIERVRFA